MFSAGFMKWAEAAVGQTTRVLARQVETVEGDEAESANNDKMALDGELECRLVVAARVKNSNSDALRTTPGTRLTPVRKTRSRRPTRTVPTEGPNMVALLPVHNFFQIQSKRKSMVEKNETYEKLDEMSGHLVQ